jgi:hypothetical protein
MHPLYGAYAPSIDAVAKPHLTAAAVISLLLLPLLTFVTDDAPAIDAVAKLDLTNAQQLQLLHRYFSHNQAAINFWLTHCVLPIESRQYSYRLTATSWHLADNAAGAVVGFSGTNDHHRLLPLQVQQAEPVDVQLQGTNGKMLQLLLQLATYKELQRPANSSTSSSNSGNSHQVSPGEHCVVVCGV